jgi:hypothetical protein
MSAWRCSTNRNGETTVKKTIDKRDEKRILTRRVAKQLDQTELKAVSGAGTCSNCKCDDCGQL